MILVKKHVAALSSGIQQAGSPTAEKNVTPCFYGLTDGYTRVCIT